VKGSARLQSIRPELGVYTKQLKEKTGTPDCPRLAMQPCRDMGKENGNQKIRG